MAEPPSAVPQQAASTDLAESSQTVQALREILAVISGSRDDEVPVLRAINETAMRLCGASDSIVWLIEDGRFKLGELSSIDSSLKSFMAEHPITLDRNSAAGRAALDRAPVIIHDPQADSGVRDQAVTQRVSPRAVLAVPLLLGGGVPIGVIVIFRRESHPFESQQVALVETFAEQAVIAIENVRQFQSLEARTKEVQTLNASLEARVSEQVGELERLARLKRFLSPQVADAVISSGDERLLGSHRTLIAVVFCDIRGFTAFCETAEPEETIEVLQTYHEEMGELIRAHGAGIDHRSGDGIMTIFNDPLPCDDPAGDALRMALAMRERMAELSMEWRRLGHQLGFGVGISLGYATVGMVGSEGRYDYTASGTTVNLASRLCDQARDREILVSPRAFRAVETAFDAVPHGKLSLKGISAPVDVYRVIGPKDLSTTSPTAADGN